MKPSTKPVVLITGGWRGIGLGITKALAAAGYDVAITGLGGSDSSAALLNELQSSGTHAHYYESDLSDLASPGATLKQVVNEFGHIDCLVNNAGIASPVRGDFLALKPENFDKIMGINLRGTVFFTQAVVNAMLQEKSALENTSVINITSVSAELSSPERLDYCMSKAALASFSKGLALRLASEGISVFDVRPGIIHSPMTDGVAAKYDGLIAGGLVPMNRWGEASDIGNVCASLASGNFKFATGSTIHVDGGLSIARL